MASTRVVVEPTSCPRRDGLPRAEESASCAPRGDESLRHVNRWGKAPPVDPFTGESSELRIDDRLPNLERASLWNGWTNDELLLQFAGHLCGRALLEWNQKTKRRIVL